MMLIRPVSINGNLCREFESCLKEEVSVMEGGYIITPRGEVIIVKDSDEHCVVFSKYLNSFLELDTDEIYNTFRATKMLCELGCCVYSGIRLEYIKNKLVNLENSMASLTFPNVEKLTELQKEICLFLIGTNKSMFSDSEKIAIQYGSFPDNVYSQEDVILILKKTVSTEKEIKK